MQNPNDLEDVRCDGCGAEVGPDDKVIQLPIVTLRGGSCGTPMVICAGCSWKSLNIDPAAFNMDANAWETLHNAS